MNNKVFVGGLSWNTSEAGLETAFSKCGTVTHVKIITDRETGRSRGFGFVTFENDADADQAITEFNGTELDGRSLKVSIAEDKRQTSPSGGGGSRGGNGNRW
jgi:RNA recognition motif-containing protein